MALNGLSVPMCLYSFIHYIAIALGNRHSAKSSMQIGKTIWNRWEKQQIPKKFGITIKTLNSDMEWRPVLLLSVLLLSKMHKTIHLFPVSESADAVQ